MKTVMLCACLALNAAKRVNQVFDHQGHHQPLAGGLHTMVDIHQKSGDAQQ